MAAYVSKKLILLFPACDEVVSHPLNAWKNSSAKDLSNLRLLAIWWIGMNLNDFPAPYSIQKSFKGTNWLMLAIAIMTTPL